MWIPGLQPTETGCLAGFEPGGVPGTLRERLLIGKTGQLGAGLGGQGRVEESGLATNHGGGEQRMRMGSYGEDGVIVSLPFGRGMHVVGTDIWVACGSAGQISVVILFIS